MNLFVESLLKGFAFSVGKVLGWHTGEKLVKDIEQQKKARKRYRIQQYGYDEPERRNRYFNPQIGHKVKEDGR